jgi:hypothetical protein
MTKLVGKLNEQGYTNFRTSLHRIRLFSVVAAAAALLSLYPLHEYFVRPNFSPLQSEYYGQYLRSSLMSHFSFSRSRYTYLVATIRDHKSGREWEIGVTDYHVTPVRDEQGQVILKDGWMLFQVREDLDPQITIKDLHSTKQTRTDKQANEWFRDAIYGGKTLTVLWRPAWLGALIIFLVGTVGATVIYHVFQHRFVQGQQLRGTRELSPKRYQKEHRKDTGYNLKVYPQQRDKLKEFVGLNPRAYRLTVPPKEECEGLLLLGDTGTGKSQMLHQFLVEIKSREAFEAVVIYDPVGEFIEHHFDPATDIILNPLDVRAPYWNPAHESQAIGDEVRAAELQFIAESFFPDYPNTPPTTQFFNKAARAIFARMLSYNPEPEQLVQWLTDDRMIDCCVHGTELAFLIDRGAKAQRAGVLATLAEVGESLRLLPTYDQAQRRPFTFHQWAQRRDRRIFITSTQTTREPLRRLQAAQFNILFGKLLSRTPLTPNRPCWVLIDEAHSLKRLPVLETALVEGRKHNVKPIIGTQNRAQLRQHYQDAAATIIAASHTKVFQRTNEVESARWVSEMIGQKELERPRVSTTASVQTYGRDSLNYAPGIEQHYVVSTEQIMALENLHGFWKYGDAVVPFRIEPIERPKRARAFVPRSTLPPIKPAPPQPLPVAPPTFAIGNGHDHKRETEIKIEATRDTDDLDIKF